ncbi:MAG: cell filamentation protein Fic [Balneolaceae bacterium]|nr:MAG: cell filamentation protein Fic [Balneolaceae bacterium]
MPTFLESLPEVFVSNTEISAQVSQAVSDGKLKKLASRLYTKNFVDDPEVIVKRNWYTLLKDYYPDALIADRTALENRPAEDGSVFIISDKKRNTELPGIIFKPRKGHGPLESDLSFINDLHITSESRTLVENMRPSRVRKGTVSRTLSRKEMEEKLDKLFRLKGDEHVNKIRDNARDIAKETGMMNEFRKLDDLIGTLQGTREAELITSVAKARKGEEPYDPDRTALFLQLFEDLKKVAPDSRTSSGLSQEERINISFFEAYFSNFIEGTEFEVSEAADIVFRNAIPSERPDDAHDVLGTYRLVSNYYEMSQLPTDFDDFIAKLKYRHSEIMAARKEKSPGLFKNRVNVAGSTQFVLPDLVKGTLRKGFEIYRALEYSFHKAVYMMFMVSEVHPFVDGNGRVARIMMNAELVSVQDQKIIIPIVYRNNYLAALKALTNHQNSAPLIRTLDFAQKFTRSVDWSDFDQAKNQLESCNAFIDPNEADREGVRLRLRE